MWQRHKEGGMPVMKKKSAPEMLGKVVPPMRYYDYFEGESRVGFKAGKGKFCLENSWHLAEAGLIAYEEPNFIRNVYMLRGFDGFRFFDNSPTEAFVAWKGKTAIVAFRGTELKSIRTVLDIGTDASFTRAEFLGGYAHKGFKEGLLSIWEGKEIPAGWAPWASSSGMEAFLKKLMEDKPGMSIFLTGHSLGAALATIAAALFPRAAALYTFGSPMVGDEAFTKNIAIPHYRWVNNRDFVTFIPPPEIMAKVLKYSYAHCGEEKYLDAEGRLTAPPANRSFNSLVAGNFDKYRDTLADAIGAIDRLKGLAEKVRGKDADPDQRFSEIFIDHAPVNYAVKIWNLLS
jgi:triacylglycerol lipase